MVDQANDHNRRRTNQYRREQERPGRFGEDHYDWISAGGGMSRAREEHGCDRHAHAQPETERAGPQEVKRHQAYRRGDQVAADHIFGLGQRALRQAKHEDATRSKRRDQ